MRMRRQNRCREGNDVMDFRHTRKTHGVRQAGNTCHFLSHFVMIVPHFDLAIAFCFLNFLRLFRCCRCSKMQM